MPDSRNVLVYSGDSTVRSRVRASLGTGFSCTEIATGPAVLEALDDSSFAIAILDAESTPYGGIGLAKQIRDEYEKPPLLIILTARADDRWLVDWSRADASLGRAVDPIELAQIVHRLTADK